MNTDSPIIPEAEAQMQKLESNFAEMTLALQLFLIHQANTQPPHVFPSILNLGSEDPHTTPVPGLPGEQISNVGGTQHIKQACPNEFRGDHMKGCMFLNSCELYMALVPHQFADDHVKIMWALPFMKSGQAACFVDCQMRSYHNIGSLSYQSWQEFVDEFIINFCPKNKVQTLRFFQGG
jgi:hypothetical protein